MEPGGLRDISEDKITKKSVKRPSLRYLEAV
jgi:hypothetical protein